MFLLEREGEEGKKKKTSEENSECTLARASQTLDPHLSASSSCAPFGEKKERKKKPHEQFGTLIMYTDGNHGNKSE